MKITSMEPEFIASGKAAIRTAVQKFMDTGQYEKDDVPAINMAVRMILNPDAYLACLYTSDGVSLALKWGRGYDARWVESYDSRNYVRYIDGVGTLLKEMAGICPAHVKVEMGADTNLSFTATAHPAGKDTPFICESPVMATAVCQLFLLVFAEALEERLAQGENDGHD